MKSELNEVNPHAKELRMDRKLSADEYDERELEEDEEENEDIESEEEEADEEADKEADEEADKEADEEADDADVKDDEDGADD
jgi:hypothetical protein